MTVLLPFLVGIGTAFGLVLVFAVFQFARVAKYAPKNYVYGLGTIAAGVLGYIVADHNWYGIPLALVGHFGTGIAGAIGVLWLVGKAGSRVS